MSAPRRRFTALVAVSALALAACGSTDTDPTAAVADVPAAGTETDADGGSGSGDGADDGADAGSDSGGDREPPTQEEVEAASLAYEQCLDDAGVDIDFGSGGGEAIDGSTDGEAGNGAVIDGGEFDDIDGLEAAFEECEGILEDTFGSFEPSPEDEARLRDAEAAFANCMSERGFDFEEPGDGSGVIQFDESVDEDALQEALDECSASAYGDDGFSFGAEGDEVEG